MVSANGFTWKDFSTSGFTLANIITMYRFTWASSVSTNRFSWTNITSAKGFIRTKIDSTNRITWMNNTNLTVLLGCISLILRVFLQHAIAWKVSRYGDFLVCIFPHSDWIRRGVFLPIHSECGKIQTKKNSVFGHFWCSERYYYIWIYSTNIKNTNRFTWTNITTPGSLTRINRTSTNGFNWMAITTTDRFT